ncbi:iron ABC transporter permease [Flavobacterium agricola]|uniref:Iron ABC transporter permease n=1 Tax=Flavobacterium agricola TaxID=2870839 RepID=A0ABY6M407_9FLAO|nr:iron ABC transporter permease [Flavobacterium agricola]UYW02305.1 iron ABC transporter permease [Flavobacterium agricola]
MNKTLAYIICYVLPIPVLLISLGIGSSEQLNFFEYLQMAYQNYFGAGLDESQFVRFELYSNIVFNIRLPRIILTFLTGAALATSGTVLQGVYRNPLVDSYVLGISAGAAFGAALAINYGLGSVNVAAFVGGALAVLITYLVVVSIRQVSIMTIVLSGMVISGMFTALLTVVQYISNPFKLQIIVQWLMGSLHATSWVEVQRSYIPILITLLIVYILRWRLNVLSLGDDAGKSVGVNPVWDRLILVSCATIMTATTVASAGLISFYGLFLPHIVRMMLGADNRKTIPGSILLGGTLLLIIDNFSRALFTFELPVGIFTMLIGGSFFIYLMGKNNLNWK